MSLHHQLPLDTCIKSFINHPAHVSTADPSLIHCRTRSSSSAYCPLLSSPYFFLSFSTLIVLSSVQWSASLVSLYQPHHLSHQCFLMSLQCLFLSSLLVFALPSSSVSSIFPSPSFSWTWLNHLPYQNTYQYSHQLHLRKLHHLRFRCLLQDLYYQLHLSVQYKLHQNWPAK